jgi:hypothetical protein
VTDLAIELTKARPTEPFADLLQELDAVGNHVRVMVFRACRAKDGRRYTKRVMDELNPTKAVGVPSLALADNLRMLRGEKPIYLREALRRMGGLLLSVSPNLRTNAGINYMAGEIWGTDSGQVAVADWIALNNNTNAPAAGDTSSTVQWAAGQATDAAASATRAEWTGLGLSRKVATMAHTSNATTLTATATWTATGTSTATQMAGLFGGAAKTAVGAGATNVLVLENTFTPTSLVNNDQLTLVWTITF